MRNIKPSSCTLNAERLAIGWVVALKPEVTI